MKVIALANDRDICDFSKCRLYDHETEQLKVYSVELAGVSCREPFWWCCVCPALLVLHMSVSTLNVGDCLTQTLVMIPN